MGFSITWYALPIIIRCFITYAWILMRLDIHYTILWHLWEVPIVDAWELLFSLCIFGAFGNLIDRSVTRCMLTWWPLTCAILKHNCKLCYIHINDTDSKIGAIVFQQGEVSKDNSQENVNISAPFHRETDTFLHQAWRTTSGLTYETYFQSQWFENNVKGGPEVMASFAVVIPIALSVDRKYWYPGWQCSHITLVR